MLILALNNSRSFTQWCTTPWVECSWTRVKDVEFLIQVKDILIFNFGWMQKPISSVRYDDKLYRTNEWRQNLTFFGLILIVTSNLSWLLLWLQLRGHTNQYFQLDFYYWRKLHLTWSFPMEKLYLWKILEFLMDQTMHDGELSFCFLVILIWYQISGQLHSHQNKKQKYHIQVSLNSRYKPQIQNFTNITTCYVSVNL